MTKENRRKQPKVNPLGNRREDFRVRLWIYALAIIAAIVIRIAILEAGHLMGWW